MELRDAVPYAEFRDSRVQELRRAGRTSVMRHVDLANRYLEDRADAVDR